MAFKNATLVLTAAEQIVYTVPAGKEAVVHSLFVTPLVPDTTVTLKAAGGHIGKDLPLVEGGSLYYPKPANLADGETLVAACGVDGDAEIFLSILEQDAV